MKQYNITFETTLRATKPLSAAQIVAEGLIENQYPRLILSVVDAETKEKTEFMIEVEK